MKKVMKKSVVLFCLVAGGVFAAEKKTAKPELVATVELAPFGDISKKVVELGTMVNNPLLPALLIGAGQERLAQTYGRFRSDAPMYGFVYARTTDDVATVVVYPSADGPAKMLLDHPGATKDDDGMLHLPADEQNPDARAVMFTGDRRFCAIAPSAVLARRALKDFAARTVRTEAVRPLVRIDVTAAGLRTRAELASFTGATAALDLTDKGLTVEGRLAARPGASAFVGAGDALPAGALDRLPAGAPLFGAMMARLACGTSSEAAFRAEIDAAAAEIRTNLVVCVQKDEKAKPYAAFVQNVADALATLLRDGASYPAAADWSGSALAFDAQLRPALISHGEAAKARLAETATTVFFDRLAAACARQWPERKALVKTDTGFVIDWAEVIDIGATVSGLADDKETKKALATARKTVATVLGDTKTILVYKADGTRIGSRVSAPGFTPPKGKPTGEARVAEALPETAAARPGAVFYCSLYGLVREAVLPLMARVASEKDAKQYGAMIAAMPAAAPNSAVAGALWAEKDGSCRGLLRITANELKNFGAAFNAFTAASLSSALDTDDDDEEDDE